MYATTTSCRGLEFAIFPEICSKVAIAPCFWGQGLSNKLAILQDFLLQTPASSRARARAADSLVPIRARPPARKMMVSHHKNGRQFASSVGVMKKSIEFGH
jgi:hypothetical protein